MSTVDVVVLWYINTYPKPFGEDRSAAEWDEYFASFTTVPVLVKKGMQWSTTISQLRQLILTDHAINEESFEFPFVHPKQFDLAFSDNGSFGESRCYLPEFADDEKFSLSDLNGLQKSKQHQWKNLSNIVVLYIVPPRPPKGNLYFQLISEEESKLVAIQLNEDNFLEQPLALALNLLSDDLKEPFLSDYTQAIIDPSGFLIDSEDQERTLKDLGIWKHSVIQVLIDWDRLRSDEKERKSQDQNANQNNNNNEKRVLQPKKSFSKTIQAMSLIVTPRKHTFCVIL
jgi:hypothetical protein